MCTSAVLNDVFKHGFIDHCLVTLEPQSQPSSQATDEAVHFPRLSCTDHLGEDLLQLL